MSKADRNILADFFPDDENYCHIPILSYTVKTKKKRKKFGRRVRYEWNFCDLNRDGDIENIDHCDSLQSYSNPEEVFTLIKDNKMLIRLQRWVITESYEDFDYAYVNDREERFYLEQVTDGGGKVAKRFQKELDDYFNLEGGAK